MLPLVAIFLCAINVVTAHFIDVPFDPYNCVGDQCAEAFAVYDAYFGVYQAYIVLLALGAVVSDGSQRDKSILTVLLIWAAWILATDQKDFGVSDYIISLESMLFSLFVMWAIVRPYFYTSATLSLRSENVYIGFYHGSHAPLSSSLGALFGLPFSSIIIVAGETVLRSSGCGKMAINSAAAINPDDYTFIDTGKKATAALFEEIAACSGLPTKAFGIFRTKCICNCEPVLSLIGLKPKSWFHRMPSIFYYQCVRQANG